MIPPHNLFELLQLVILVYFVVVNIVYMVFTGVAFFDLISYRWRVWRGDLRVILSEASYRPISVLVPCHNEEETIVANIRGLLTLGYPEFEIIIINDGSTDETLPVLQRAFGLFPVPSATQVRIETQPIRRVCRSLDHPNLLLVDKEQGGKSDALNAGLNVCSYPLFCSIDADSLLESDALLRVSRVLQEDFEIVAAGGIIRVLNGTVVEGGRVTEVRAPRRLLPRFQALEYVRGFLAGRRTLSKLNALLIISGAFGLFRKDPVIEVGGYRPDTVGEDMELIARLHRHARREDRRARVAFVPDPVCWTQVPSDVRSLLRQRDRWHRGLLETLWFHRGLFLNPRYGRIGLIAMPYYLFIEALGPVVETLGYVLIPVLFLLGALNPTFALLFFILAVLYGIILSVTALIIDDLLFSRYRSAGDLLRMIVAALIEFIVYRQVLAFTRSLAWVTVFLRRRRWGEMRREEIPHSENTGSQDQLPDATRS
jgi:cellulose synthase/poly-beta-1,6-N-acetylglucosamine synthase-like glycosyltransferase